MFIRQQAVAGIQEKVHREKIKCTFTAFAVRKRYLAERAQRKTVNLDASGYSSNIPVINVTENIDQRPPTPNIPKIVLDNTSESDSDIQSASDNSRRVSWSPSQ